MSDAGNMPPASPDGPESGPPGLPSEPPRRSGCLTAFMVVAGVTLLLPGLCAIIFGRMMLSEAHVASDVVSFVVLGLAVGCFGVILIWTAFHRPRP